MASNAKKVAVKLGDWRMGSFDPQMHGVEKITHTPQEVAASKQEELQKKADGIGVALVFSEPGSEPASSAEGTAEKEGE